MSEPRIYRYIVKTDAGTAPNPYDGFCTLAICKPAIRRTAQVGDWILGFRSQRRGHVVYAMKVEAAMPFDEYWRDPRFRSRRPDVSTTPTDNIYRGSAMGADGTIVMQWVRNTVHEEAAKPRDLSGRRVLVATRFWYFGEKSPPIDESLAHLAPVTQGHVVHKHRIAQDPEHLQRWLSKFSPGLTGWPIDRPTAAAPDELSPSCATTRTRTVPKKVCR